MGLPEITVAGSDHTNHEDRNSADYKSFVRRQVFANPFIWWVSLANFFVYILRFATPEKTPAAAGIGRPPRTASASDSRSSTSGCRSPDAPKTTCFAA